jgi:hypothetical protein
MNDYPRDGGKGMKDHFNGDKMLFDVPEDIASPTVRVDGDIYFVNELLQLKNGGYFIPQCFLYAAVSNNTTEAAEELCALGNKVERSDVRVIISIIHGY